MSHPGCLAGQPVPARPSQTGPASPAWSDTRRRMGLSMRRVGHHGEHEYAVTLGTVAAVTGQGGLHRPAAGPETGSRRPDELVTADRAVTIQRVVIAVRLCHITLCVGKHRHLAILADVRCRTSFTAGLGFDDSHRSLRLPDPHLAWLNRLPYQPRYWQRLVDRQPAFLHLFAAFWTFHDIPFRFWRLPVFLLTMRRASNCNFCI